MAKQHQEVKGGWRKRKWEKSKMQKRERKERPSSSNFAVLPHVLATLCLSN